MLVELPISCCTRCSSDTAWSLVERGLSSPCVSMAMAALRALSRSWSAIRLFTSSCIMNCWPSGSGSRCNSSRDNRTLICYRVLLLVIHTMNGVYTHVCSTFIVHVYMYMYMYTCTCTCICMCAPYIFTDSRVLTLRKILLKELSTVGRLREGSFYRVKSLS